MKPVAGATSGLHACRALGVLGVRAMFSNASSAFVASSPAAPSARPLRSPSARRPVSPSSLCPGRAARRTAASNALDGFRHETRNARRLQWVHSANRIREDEANRVGACLHGNLDMQFIRKAANFHEHAALPASRIAVINAAGSSLRIRAVPTSAIE